MTTVLVIQIALQLRLFKIHRQISLQVIHRFALEKKLHFQFLKLELFIRGPHLNQLNRFLTLYIQTEMQLKFILIR